MTPLRSPTRFSRPRAFPRLACALASLLASGSLPQLAPTQADSTSAIPGPAAPAPASVLVPFHWTREKSKTPTLRPLPNPQPSPTPTPSPTPPPTTAFFAHSAERWPPGLVPVFGIEKDSPPRFELRRLPPQGQENWTEPLFFALPPENESTAPFLAGRWALVSTNSQNHRHFLNFDLALHSHQIAGRFDPDTDFRFASISGGTVSNTPNLAFHIELKVDYIRDQYHLTGQFDPTKNELHGAWRHVEGADSGVWIATRTQTPPPIARTAEAQKLQIAPLYEWQRPSDGALHYSILPPAEPGEWRRRPTPLARVWVPKPTP